MNEGLIGSSAYSERACRAIYPATDFALVIRTLYDVARSRLLEEIFGERILGGFEEDNTEKVQGRLACFLRKVLFFY